MKNSLKLALVMLLGFTATSIAHAASQGSMAPDRVGRWDLGLGIAAGMNDGADDASFVSASTSYGVTPYIGLGIEGGWQEADGDAADETIGFVPVLFDIIVRVPTVSEKIVPYGVLGLGAMGVYVEKDNADDVDDTAFAWKLGGGLDWFINNNWIFNFEVAYWDSSVSLPATSFGDDASFWTVGIALKYVF